MSILPPLLLLEDESNIPKEVSIVPSLLLRVILPPEPVSEEKDKISLVAILLLAVSAIGPPVPLAEESKIPALVSIIPLLLVIVIPAGEVILPRVIF